MKKIDSFFVTLATVGPIGYLPASGTWGTLVALPLVYVLWALNISYSFAVTSVLMCTVVALLVIKKALAHMNRADDPSEIILDEVVGCLITFLGIPLHASLVIVGFLLFRFFDITKCGIRSCELLFGTWGVVCDDIAAGIISNIILQLLVYSFAL